MIKVFIVLFFWFAPFISFCQYPATGDWIGTLDVGVKLRLVLHIQSGAGGLDGTLDSPDQGVKGIKASSVMMTGDSLHVKIDVIKGSFDGLFINDTTVSGAWNQGVGKAALTLVRTKEIVVLKRPQTPKPPFSYKSEDIEYDNADKSVHFGATLTYPSSGGPFPAALLLTGSGQQDRDEALFEHRPFAVIADELTRRGFAVLRVDDRGVGKTTGEVMTATSADFADDAEAGINYLKNLPQIDKNKIGLIGHSEGGLIASLIASRRKDIDFIVLLAGPGMKGSDLMSLQAKAVLESAGISSSTASAYQSFYTKLMNICINEKDSSVAMKKGMSAFEQWKKAASLNTLKELSLDDGEAASKIVSGLVQSFSQPWIQYFIKSNAPELLQKTNAKVLALNGEKDLQVLPQPNINEIKEALKKSKSKVYDAKILPGLNHLFQKCNVCTVAEYGQLEQTFSQDALNEMGVWLEQNVLSKR